MPRWPEVKLVIYPNIKGGPEGRRWSSGKIEASLDPPADPCEVVRRLADVIPKTATWIVQVAKPKDMNDGPNQEVSSPGTSDDGGPTGPRSAH